MLEDGNFGGRYQRNDNEMLAIWAVAVRGNPRAAGGVVMRIRS